MKQLNPLLKQTFKWFVRPRLRSNRKARSASGGVAIGLRREFAQGAEEARCERTCDGVIAIKIPSANVGSEQDIYVFGVYNPPPRLIVYGRKGGPGAE